MKKTRFAVFQESIDEKYLEEAAGGAHKKNYTGLIALAACACIAILGVVTWKPWDRAKTAETYGIQEAPAAAFGATAETAEFEEATDWDTVEPEACEEEAPAEAVEDTFCMDADEMPVPEPEENSVYASGTSRVEYEVILPETAEELGASILQENGVEIQHIAFSFDGFSFELKYVPGTEGQAFYDSFETDDASENVTVNSAPAKLSRREDNTLSLVWRDSETGLSFCLSTGEETPEDLLTELAEQLKITIR